jgi:hypothetical protein
MTLSSSLWKVLKAGVTYFGLVFGMGFILGPIRIALVVPQVGERIAELMEMPLMLAVIIFAARWVVRKFNVPPTVGLRLGIGFLAVAFVVILEFTLVLKLRGLTLTEYFQNRDPVAGTVYYLMLGVFALMPWLVGNRDEEPVDCQLPNRS